MFHDIQNTYSVLINFILLRFYCTLAYCLVLAGWLDNAGSFDGLIPLLSLPSPHVVAIDLPGHGLSSHRPPGTNDVFINYLTDIRRGVDGELI